MKQLAIPPDYIVLHISTWQEKVENDLQKARKTGYFGGFSCKNQKAKKILKIIQDNCKNILVGKPDVLEGLISKVEEVKQGLNKTSKLYSKILPKIFDYDSFRNRKTKSGAFNYIKSLKVYCCPYCNRHYTFSLRTVNGGKERIIKPELDHFFNKARYPYLSISLYNLVPSCTLCNSRLKHDKNFKLKSHLNPFLHSFHENYKFKIILKKDENGNYDAVQALRGNPKYSQIVGCAKTNTAKKNAEVFCLENLYNCHEDYVEEILEKKYAYNNDLLDILSKFFNKKIRMDDIKRLFYGNYLKDEDINKRPLSKLTIDLLEDDVFIDLKKN
jgi:hypothetical protein